MPVQRALLSVSDKTGLLDFAKQLHARGIELLSTGGTAKLLSDNDVPVTEVSDYTGFPEMMDGRVKTLHPKIHGGILARRGTDDAVMEKHDIPGIDLIIVNLYPFAETIAKEGCTLEDAIENIDIGGPTMVRAAAKNNAHVTIVVNPSDYSLVEEELANTLSSSFADLVEYSPLHPLKVEGQDSQEHRNKTHTNHYRCYDPLDIVFDAMEQIVVDNVGCWC